MNFPYFQVPYLGHGMVIGFNAVVHVILSHGVAIGVFLAIVLAEYIGYRRKRLEWEQFAHFAIKPTAIVISSVGAITGVGIWFTIGTLVPRASSSMLRIFFWPWFLEWIVFTAEAIVLVSYYLLWEKMSATDRGKRWHIALGFSYPVLGLLSAFLITGIIGYMLTPDGYPWTWNRWDGFFNASLLPQTMIRFFGGIALGMVMVFILPLLWRERPSFHPVLFRFYAFLFLIAAVFTGIFSYTYFARVPETFKTHHLFAMLTSHFSQHPEVYYIANTAALVLLLAFAAVALLKLRLAVKILLAPALVATFAFVAEFERTREFIRGPYVMPGYMFANQVLVAEAPYLNATGALQRDFWFQATSPQPDYRQIGAVLFAQNCKSCHSIGGVNDIRARLRGRPEDAISVLLDHTNELVPFMPPFSGTREEKLAYGRYLYEVTNRDSTSVGHARFPELAGGER